jgi:NAD(P)-dependent dehydrogenase (short-subunit alcohol dehydrogenase family)
MAASLEGKNGGSEQQRVRRQVRHRHRRRQRHGSRLCSGTRGTRLHGGATVNISTFSAFEPSPAFPLSSSLRAALGGFTKLYADRYAADGVRMNNVLPGYIESFEIDEETRESIPMRRRGSVAEIAKTVAFLLSDDSGYMTGQNIRVEGGLTRSV